MQPVELYQHDALVIESFDQMSKGFTVVNIGRCCVPCGHQTLTVEHHPEFAAYDPAMIAQSLLADLPGTAALATIDRMPGTPRP